MRAAICALALLTATTAQASSKLCVFDPAGRSGEYYEMVQSFADEHPQYDLEVKPYADEELATRDYEAKQCSGVLATGTRLQRFNSFPSTIEAIGALPDYRDLTAMVKHGLQDRRAENLKKGGHETVGFIPVGAVYLIVRDKNVNSVRELAGKKIATLDFDKASPVLVERVGANVILADLGTLGPKFNNGDVDAVYVSVPAIAPFELQKGIGTEGGILKYPLAQATLQLMVRSSDLPADFGATSRAWFADHVEDGIASAQRAEKDLPASTWVEVEDTEDFDDMFLNVRLALRGSGTYDGTLLKDMRKARCYRDSARSECVEKRE